jgi:AAA domain
MSAEPDMGRWGPFGYTDEDAPSSKPNGHDKPKSQKKRGSKTVEEIAEAKAFALRPVSLSKLSDIAKGTYVPKVPLFADDRHAILFPGAHLIVGRPKVGKSWLLLQMALCAARKEQFLGMKAMRSDIGVLLICAEDDDARIKGRLQALGETGAPENCFVVTGEEFRYIASVRSPYQSFPEFLEQWLTENPTIKLVLVDTETTCLQTWLGEQISADDPKRITDQDYKQTRGFDDIGLKHGAIIGLVNHTSKRKGEVFDIHELINRTNVALAGASGSLVLADMPGTDPMDTSSKQRILGARGRDMTDDVLLCVRQEKDIPMFTCLGEYTEVQQTQSETAILEAVEEFQQEEGIPGHRYLLNDIAEHLGIKRQAVKRAVSRMLEKPNGKFWKNYTVDVKRGRNGGIKLVER